MMSVEPHKKQKTKESISIVFVDGCFMPEQSDMELLPKTILFCPFNVVVNWMQGVFIYVPKHTVVTLPIHIVFEQTGKKSHHVIRNTIVVEENSQMTILEEYKNKTTQASDYAIDTATDIRLEQKSVMHYYKIQTENPLANHQAALLIQQAEGSESSAFLLDNGSNKATTTVRVNLHEKQARCELSGLYYLNRDEQQVSQHIHIDHAAPYSQSTMHFKGILNKQSSAEFVGKVFVHKEAQHISAEQSNHNLLLSQRAEVKTKPELEIYADDVRCSHGATVGQLDEEALFYLRSRGIEKAEALHLLTEAFASEIVNNIKQPAIRHYIEKRVNNE